MNDKRQIPPRKIVCPWCQGIVTLPAERCWLCCEKLPKVEDLPPNSFITTPLETKTALAGNHQFSLASLLIFVTLACVLLGLATIAPGIALPLGLMAFFAWLRTTELSERRQEKGLAVSSRQRALLFLGSMTTYALVLTLLGAAGAATLATAFLVICAPLFGETPKASQLALAIGVMLFGTLGVVGMLMLATKVRRRWLGETDPPGN